MNNSPKMKANANANANANAKANANANANANPFVKLAEIYVSLIECAEMNCQDTKREKNEFGKYAFPNASVKNHEDLHKTFLEKKRKNMECISKHCSMAALNTLRAIGKVLDHKLSRVPENELLGLRTIREIIKKALAKKDPFLEKDDMKQLMEMLKFDGPELNV